jgi:hypothetical protein
MSLTLRRSGWVLVSLLLPALAAAQAGKLVIPDFSDLAKKATEAVDITLDGDMLKSATHMLGGAGRGNSSDTDVAGLVSGLKAISVRSFTFEKPDMYSTEDVERVLAQVNAPGWKKVISVREKGEHVEIHMRENTEDGGLLIVTEEPRELTIVNIAGKINMDQLRQLQGHMGVPNLQGIVGAAGPAAPVPPTPPAVTSAAPPAPAAQQVSPAPPAPPAARADP